MRPTIGSRVFVRIPRGIIMFRDDWSLCRHITPFFNVHILCHRVHCLFHCLFSLPVALPIALPIALLISLPISMTVSLPIALPIVLPIPLQHPHTKYTQYTNIHEIGSDNKQ
jgi:hypothetical protein